MNAFQYDLRWECGECGKEFYQKGRARKHLREIHTANNQGNA